MSGTCTVHILYLYCANNIIHTLHGANLELTVRFEFQSVPKDTASEEGGNFKQGHTPVNESNFYIYFRCRRELY